MPLLPILAERRTVGVLNFVNPGTVFYPDIAAASAASRRGKLECNPASYNDLTPSSRLQRRCSKTGRTLGSGGIMKLYKLVSVESQEFVWKKVSASYFSKRVSPCLLNSGYRMTL